MMTVLSGFSLPVSTGLTNPFYIRALRLFDHLEKNKDAYTLHSMGNFPKINFLTVDEFGDGNTYYSLQAAVAGYSIDEIEVLINQKNRTISIQNAPRKPPTEEEIKEADKREGIIIDTWVHEIKSSAFNRTITVPDDADLEKVKCQYRSGILEMIIPINKNSSEVSKLKIDVVNP